MLEKRDVPDYIHDVFKDSWVLMVSALIRWGLQIIKKKLGISPAE